MTHSIRDWKHCVDVLNQISFPTTQMGHLFPSKEVLSCYFQHKPLWQRSSIPRRCWNLASCWCSAGVLGLWKHAPGILQTIHMHGDALLLQLLSELTGLPSHFQKYLSIVHSRSCCTFATLNCTPSSADNEPRVQL